MVLPGGVNNCKHIFGSIPASDSLGCLSATSRLLSETLKPPGASWCNIPRVHWVHPQFILIARNLEAWAPRYWLATRWGNGAALSRSGVIWNLRPEVSSGPLIYDGSVDPNSWSVAAWRGGGNWVVVGSDLGRLVAMRKAIWWSNSWHWAYMPRQINCGQHDTMLLPAPSMFAGLHHISKPIATYDELAYASRAYTTKANTHTNRSHFGSSF